MKLNKIKEQGNALFTQKKFDEAIEKFSEGINLYLKDQETFKTDRDVKLKVTQLYTNRSLAHHQLSNQKLALEDADHVIKNLDSLNVKALNRRAFALKSLNRVEDSIRDYQTLLKVNPAGEKEIRKELDELMKKLIEIQKAKKEEASKPKAKI